MKKKRRQSLVVGSECVEFLRLKRGEVEDWRKGHPVEETTKKLETLNTRQEQNEATEMNEAKELYNWMREHSKDRNNTLTRRYISQNSDLDAKGFNSLIKILIQNKKIEQVDKNTYKIF
jgi:deoxyhypusine synthase